MLQLVRLNGISVSFLTVLGRSVGWSVCHNFIKGLEVTLTCFSNSLDPDLVSVLRSRIRIPGTKVCRKLFIRNNLNIMTFWVSDPNSILIFQNKPDSDPCFFQTGLGSWIPDPDLSVMKIFTIFNKKLFPFSLFLTVISHNFDYAHSCALDSYPGTKSGSGPRQKHRIRNPDYDWLNVLKYVDEKYHDWGPGPFFSWIQSRRNHGSGYGLSWEVGSRSGNFQTGSETISSSGDQYPVHIWNVRPPFKLSKPRWIFLNYIYNSIPLN